MSDYRKSFIDRLSSGARITERERMQIILSNGYGGRDMEKLAQRLMERFPSVTAVLGADYIDLVTVEGMTEHIALYLKALYRLKEREARDGLKISDKEEFFSVVSKRFYGRDNEFAELYLVGRGGKIKNLLCYTSDNVARVNIPQQKIVADIALSAPLKVYCAHNHICESLKPSPDDDRFTLLLVSICKLYSIKFCDHAIINCYGKIFSYRDSGRLDEIIATNRF